MGTKRAEPFTWSGACVAGMASGQGTLTFLGGKGVYAGGMRAGKLHGFGSMRNPKGTVSEGSYAEDKRRGRWVIR